MFLIEARPILSRTGAWLGSLLLCLGTICGQNGRGVEIPGKLPRDLWPTEAGWQQTVTAIIQSHEGYLWLATYHGLVRFDGARFTVFDDGNSTGLPNGLITSLYEDAEGVLWIGHETGELSRLIHGRFEQVELKRGWRGGAMEAITTDEDGDLWLLNDAGLLFRLRDGKSAICPGGATPSRKAALSRDLKGKLWITSNGVVATLEHGEVVPRHFDQTNNTEFYERTLPARDGGIWVLSNGRLRKWKEDRWVAEMTDYPREPGATTVLLETRSGILLAGTLRDGLYLFTTNAEPLHFSRTNGLSHDWVRSLCEDHEGNMWIGTGGSLDTLRPRKITMLNAPDNWGGCAVLSFIVTPSGSAWIGTEGAGLYRYENDNWTHYGESSGVSNAFVWSVFQTKQGRLMAGTWGGGLLVKDGDRFANEGALGRITAPVLSMYEGQQGELWIGTKAGLNRFEAGKLTWSAGADQLLFPDVRAITQTPDGTVWFGMSGGGLGSFKDGVLKQRMKKDGLGSEVVLCLYPELDGTLWFGTADRGLGRLQEGKFSTISTEQGLPSSVICHIVDDGVGNLWLSTHAGIVRASKEDLRRCADGAAKNHKPVIKCVNYGKAEGLASLICSGGFQPGACKAADERLWFPTAKGLAILEPGNVSINLAKPPVVIEGLVVDGQRIEIQGRAEQDQAVPVATDSLPGSVSNPISSLRNATSALRISPGSQRFEIGYTALSFAAPDKVRFKCRLEGLESDWVDVGTKRMAQYSYLPPGDYTFHVIACNNDGIWNESGAKLGFTVLPHFWQTWWFNIVWVVSGAGVVGATVFWISRVRVRRKLELLERQRALERERARIARDIHDDLGASLTRITMLSQSARGELDPGQQAAADLDQIYSTARELTRAMDEIVWAVNPKHDTLDSLVTYLGRFAQQFLSATAIRCRLEVPLHLPPWALTAELRHNVFLAFKEALNNVVKHATASEVQISLELVVNGFILAIADNGRGFNLGEVKGRAPTPEGVRLSPGNGIANMEKRLEEVGGHCNWETEKGKGTVAKLRVTLT